MSETNGKKPFVNIVIIILVLAILGGIYFLKSGKNTSATGETASTEEMEEIFPALVDYGSHG